MDDTGLLGSSRTTPISSEGKVHFERTRLANDAVAHIDQLTSNKGVRSEQVPRYLFRAWHAESMGAPNNAISTATAILPPLFMPKLDDLSGRDKPDFYATPENQLFNIAFNHYNGSKISLSGFSSWTASLHFVLSYAMNLESNGHASSIAVIDTHDLADEVLVWHAPHLLGVGYGNHEYLAFGIIRGKGLQSVSMIQLRAHGLMHIFPELGADIIDNMGFKLRRDMFEKPPKALVQGEADVIRSLSALFGDLAHIVSLALVCLRPRIWHDWREKTGSQDEAEVRNHREDLVQLAANLNIAQFPAGLASENWLDSATVNTSRPYEFPDVRQWIDLIVLIADALQPHPEQDVTGEQSDSINAGEKRPRDDADGEGSEDETKDEKEEEEPVAKRRDLRERTEISYTTCKEGDCGKCMECVGRSRT